jgi:high-affinity nickel-transport protein
MNVFALRQGVWGYFAAVVGLHVIGFVLLWLTAPHHPVLVGLGLLAYRFGVRHAFDADHIAAIDNVVRKLLQQNKNPLGVGFYFSLGHSTVVTVMTIFASVGVFWVERTIPRLRELGSLVGTSVSGVFLLLIGVANLEVLVSLYRVFRRMRRSSADEKWMEELILSRGFVSRRLRPVFRLVSRSWHVYPIGFLFGLGFDTASEVGLLAISAGISKGNVPFYGVLALPVLFSAGMSLFDTADGILMSNAYRWAFKAPLRKINYNLVTTALTVIAALCIGGVELLQVMVPSLGLLGRYWESLFHFDFGGFGYVLMALFLLAWGLSYLAWKTFRIPNDKKSV